MKFELKVVNGTASRQIPVEDRRGADNEEEAAIDVSQVLAASQVLLRNLGKKLEKMEQKLQGMETLLEAQTRQHLLDHQQVLMLAAPPSPVASWHPEAPALDERWFGRFSWWDRLFHPEKLRRPGADSSIGEG